MKWYLLAVLLQIFMYVAQGEIGRNLRKKFNIMEENTYGQCVMNKTFRPDWDDLDTRPLPQWYDAAKIGIFIHWGVYSVPSYHSEWFWSSWVSGNKDIKQFMKSYPKDFTYQDFAHMFTAEFFNASQWADVFVKSGAKYIVLTTKHHEGFTLFPSKRSFSWNSLDVGPKRDIVASLSKAVRQRGLKFGAYHSLYEWFNPMYLDDKTVNFTTNTFIESKLMPDLLQLIANYKPSVLWSDGDWEALDTYWNSKEFLAWLYNESPVKDTIVVNDRWGIGIPCHHGDFYNCDDRFNPGHLLEHKWENAFTLDAVSWGHRRNMNIQDVLTIEQLLKQVVSTVSCGGNALINVGPTKEGVIVPIFQERLLQLGNWLQFNGEAIYGSSPWRSQNDSVNGDVWYTCTKAKYDPCNPIAIPRNDDHVLAVYAIFLAWPKNNLLKLADIATYLHSGNYHIYLLGGTFGELKWNINSGVVEVSLPDKAKVASKWAWVLKIH